MRVVYGQRFQKFYDDLLDDRHNKVTLDKLCKTFMAGIMDSKTDLNDLKERIIDRGLE